MYARFSPVLVDLANVILTVLVHTVRAEKALYVSNTVQLKEFARLEKCKNIKEASELWIVLMASSPIWLGRHAAEIALDPVANIRQSLL